MTRFHDMLRIGKDDRGFSLVEGLMGAALIALAFIAISNLFPTGYSNITYGGNQTIAANYAQQKIEQLKNLAFNSLDANCSNVAENLGNGFSRTCVLTTNVGAAGGTPDLRGDLKKVRVTVTFPGQFRPGTFSADTLFTR